MPMESTTAKLGDVSTLELAASLFALKQRLRQESWRQLKEKYK